MKRNYVKPNTIVYVMEGRTMIMTSGVENTQTQSTEVEEFGGGDLSGAKRYNVWEE